MKEIVREVREISELDNIEFYLTDEEILELDRKDIIEEIRKEVEQDIRKEVEQDIRKEVEQDIRKEVEQDILEEGRIEGQQEEKNKIIINMNNQKFDLETISKVTNVSISKIKKIISNNK